MSSPGAGRPAGRPRHVVVLLLAALVAAHTVVVALWLMPADPVREAAGPERLARYVDPYFWQSWSALDPSRQRVDEGLRIRGRRADGSTTGWVDVTAMELDAENRLLSARFHEAPRRLAANLNAALSPLTARQERIAAQPYRQDDAATALDQALLESKVDAAVARQLVANDTMTVQYASMLAGPLWGTDVRQIRYGVGRRVIPAFGSNAAPTSMRWRDLGWRKVTPPTEASRSAGRRIVDGWDR